MEREDFGTWIQDSAGSSRVRYMKEEHLGAYLTTTMSLLLLFVRRRAERQREGGEEGSEEGTRGGVRGSSETSPR